jgi:ABC-type multidrug transport system fused ATPase/permease subunit
MVPLELQRRLTETAFNTQDVARLAVLGAVYLGVLVVQGGMKYLLNVGRGRLVETLSRRLREIVFASSAVHEALPRTDERRLEGGAMASMVAAEAEDVGGFVGESISQPLLQGGTMVAVTGYLLWLDPLIASFAAAIYLPQLVIVPRVQAAINRLARLHARQVRKLGAEVADRTERAEDGAAARRFSHLAQLTYDTRIRVYYRKFFLTALGNFLDALGPLLILCLGGWLVIRGKTDPATIVVFMSGFQKIADPWDQLVNFYRTASNARTKYALIRDSVILS